MATYDQKMAQEAFKLVSEDSFKRGKNDQYRSFAKSFPALIHTCGLAQAIAFALEKKKEGYVGDLGTVLHAVETQITGENLAEWSRAAEIIEYMRLSRRALSAASWLKRYVSAFDETSDDAAERSS
ncbi:MAG: type III-B CRISPR module-associated protein Cmr5 [Synergistaceae bacterium]|nr:type III-B CRISPR module-associated protein Cmr5 [Synergistaceae bacterium]